MSHTPAIARLIRAAKEYAFKARVTAYEDLPLEKQLLDAIRGAEEDLDASPSEVDEWIACSERMPPDDEMVVIYTNMGNLAEDWVDKDTGDFLNYPFLDESHARSATHWRPALEPPITKGAP